MFVVLQLQTTRSNHMSDTQPVITAQIFFDKTGHLPVYDDLDRCNCKDVGKPGHSACGWCPEHDLPRFMCGCRNREKFDKV